MKKLAIIPLVLIALVAMGLFSYKLASPEIVVVNASASTIQEVIVELPSNRVVFGEIKPGSENTIYYSATQLDGVYSYSITFVNAPPIIGSCGYVTNSEFGKRIQLIVLRKRMVECRETTKYSRRLQWKSCNHHTYYNMAILPYTC